MIVLFNLNKYLGGGEVLAFRFAEYLHKNNYEYVLLVHEGVNCYIKKQAINNKLNFILWPSVNDSVVYMNRTERAKLLPKIANLFNTELLYIFTFCFRDLYNSLYFFSRMKDKKIKYSTGIYHPEDIFYLSSLSINKKKIIDFNRNLACDFAKNDAIVFANETARVTTCGGSKIFSKNNIFPIPINIIGSIEKKQILDPKKVRIVSISRFVEFKIGAVFAIVRYTRKNSNIQLDLIGYGPFEILLRMYIGIFGIRNITLHGKVNPDELHEIINKASIGYAQGTSILEIAKFGIPVVIAPYSKIKDIFNSNFKCMGVFGEKDNFNYGDVKDDGSDMFVSLSQTIESILINYNYYTAKSVNHLQKFESDKIFKEIASLIRNSNYRIDKSFSPVEPPFIKKVLNLFLK